MPLLLTKQYYQVKIILPTSTATKLFFKRLNDLKYNTEILVSGKQIELSMIIAFFKY